MKRIRFYLGRLLCRMGRHKWRFFIFTVMPLGVMRQCDRCGAGRLTSPLGGHDFTAEQMQEIRTSIEIQQVAMDREIAEFLGRDEA